MRNKNGIIVLYSKKTFKDDFIDLDSVSHQDKMCKSKKRFIDEYEAQQAKDAFLDLISKNKTKGVRSKDKNHNTFEIYRCPYCNFYHIGHSNFRA